MYDGFVKSHHHKNDVSCLRVIKGLHLKKAPEIFPEAFGLAPELVQMQEELDPDALQEIVSSIQYGGVCNTLNAFVFNTL